MAAHAALRRVGIVHAFSFQQYPVTPVSVIRFVVSLFSKRVV